MCVQQCTRDVVCVKYVKRVAVAVIFSRPQQLFFFFFSFHTHTHTHIWDMQVRFMYKACLFTLVLTPELCVSVKTAAAARRQQQAALACLPRLNSRLIDALADVHRVSTFVSPIFCVIQPTNYTKCKAWEGWTPIHNVNACTTTLRIRSMQLAT